MRIDAPHPWEVSPAEAREIQRRLRGQVVTTGSPRDVRFVAGVDISVGSRFDPHRPGRAAIVVIKVPELEPVEQAVVEGQVQFPYVPGLLSFREIPVIAPAVERLRIEPDLFVVDGQGIAHPRRLGIAAHLGLLLGKPSIGCAKSRLSGHFAPPADKRGATSPLLDRGEEIGRVVRTRTGVAPVFISVGHLIGLDEAVDWIMQLTTRYRLPEPTRLAHMAAAGEMIVKE